MANVSHEVRTPLNGLIGMLELLRGTELTTQQRRYVRLAGASADALLSLMTDLLDYSQIEAGDLEIEQQPFRLRELLEDVVEAFLPRGEAQGLELTLHLAPDVPEVAVGDRDRLRQILVNLVSNAVKFTPRGGVHLRAEAEPLGASGLVLRVRVADTGPGIPAEQVDLLFQPFVRARNLQRGGLGLGLAICKRLSQLLGGKLQYDGKLGQGATFVLSVPLELGRSVPAASALPEQLRGLRVLAVDDNATNLEILQSHLQHWQLDYALADGCQRAIELLEQAAAAGRPFDVALLDVQMPGCDGFELAAQIKQRPSIRETVLVMLTSTGEVLARDRLIARGLAGCLTKPVREARLLETIVAAAATRRQQLVCQAHSQPSPAPPTPAPEPRILLAEDNEINQLVASEILFRAGYHCDTVASGRAALEATLDDAYDLILMDCQMPEMDGLEATRAIRQHERDVDPEGHQASIPIVALTANVAREDRQQCFSAGMDAYVTKPIEPGQLIGTIDRLLAHRQSQTALADPPTCPIARPEPFDVEDLLHRCLGDAKFSSMLLQKFAARAGNQQAAIERAIDSGNLVELAREAHTLKGVAANLSADELRHGAAKLEQAARGGQRDELADLLADVVDELARCVAAVPAIIEGLTLPV